MRVGTMVGEFLNLPPIFWPFSKQWIAEIRVETTVGEFLNRPTVFWPGSSNGLLLIETRSMNNRVWVSRFTTNFLANGLLIEMRVRTIDREFLNLLPIGPVQAMDCWLRYEWEQQWVSPKSTTPILARFKQWIADCSLRHEVWKVVCEFLNLPPIFKQWIADWDASGNNRGWVSESTTTILARGLTCPVITHRVQYGRQIQYNGLT